LCTPSSEQLDGTHPNPAVGLGTASMTRGALTHTAVGDIAAQNAVFGIETYATAGLHDTRKTRRTSPSRGRHDPRDLPTAARHLQAAGVDFATVARDGRLRDVTGFLEPVG
jgi:hypothetical protein